MASLSAVFVACSNRFNDAIIFALFLQIENPISFGYSFSANSSRFASRVHCATVRRRVGILCAYIQHWAWRRVEPLAENGLNVAIEAALS